MKNSFRRFALNDGFTLLELVIVLGLSSMVLVSLMAVYQSNRNDQLHYVASDRLNTLRTAGIKSLVEMDQLPVSMAELLVLADNPEAGITPWGHEVSLTHLQDGLRLETQFLTPAMAQRISANVAGSWSDNALVIMHVRPPASRLFEQNLLHRIADPENPELNAMQTDLNMNGFAITSAVHIASQNIVSDSLVADLVDTESGQFNSVFSDQGTFKIVIADQVSASAVTTDNLDADVMNASEVNAEVANIGYAQIQSADIENLDVADFYVRQLLSVSGVLDSEHITTQQLTADFAEIKDQLNVSDMIVEGHLQSILLTSTRVEAQAIVANELQATEMSAQTANIEELQADQVVVTSDLFADTIMTQNLNAQGISAQDFITDQTSLNQLRTELTNYQQLWQECLDSGGCQ